MSYILEALKKDNAASQPQTTIYAEPYQGHATKPESRAGLAWGILLVLAILGAVLLGYFLGRGQVPSQPIASQTPAAAPNVQPSIAQQEVKESVAEVTKSVETAEPAKIAAEDYFDNPPVKTTVSEVSATGVNTQLATNVEQATDVSPQPIQVGVAPAQSEAQETNEFKLESTEGVSDELLKLVQSAIDETATEPAPSTGLNQQQDAIDYSDVQPLNSFASGFQNRIPSMDFSLHIFSTTGDGWVRVNGEDVREGELAAPNVRLVKIEAQKVILKYQDTLFSLPAMTTW